MAADSICSANLFLRSCNNIKRQIATVNNILSLNKGNHDRDGVWISDLN